jgi:hypothetical protein
MIDGPQRPQHVATGRTVPPRHAAAAALILLAGCAATPGQDAESAPVIVLEPYEELSGPADDLSTSCKVGFHYVYPPDLPVSQREVFYQTGRMSDSGPVYSSVGRAGGPLELPRPERDPRPVQRDDGMMALQIRIMTFGPCVPRSTRQPPVVAFTIGDCVAGDCPPMRYQEPENAEMVRFLLVED